MAINKQLDTVINKVLDQAVRHTISELRQITASLKVVFHTFCG
jgi:hypothetical protein